MGYFFVQLGVAVLPRFVLRWFLPFSPLALKASFEPVRAQIDRYSSTFYEIFWRDYPETRELFGKNMPRAELDARINSFMTFIVENSDNPKVWIDFVKHLGLRHVRYGIFEHQFQYVSETNIKTLRILKKGNFSAEEERVWRDAFKVIERLMKISATFKKKKAA